MFFRKFSSLLIGALIALPVFGSNPTVDDRGNVVFNVTLEGLQLTAAEIHNSAVDYLENAYKDTSYEIVDNNMEKGCVIGKGHFLSFHEQGGLIKSQIYSVTFHVRVDSKNGRARIQFIARNYNIKELNDVKSGNDQELAICDCEPLGSVNMGKGHKGAFEKLQVLADKTLAAVGTAIRSTTPSMGDGNDDW